MSSESGSAVLDLNDADSEDVDNTEGICSDEDGPPVIMEHGYDIAVKVDAPMKQLSTLETYVTYRVRCVCARWAMPSTVRRRYNHFKVLHKRLTQAHPLIAIPPLPPLHSARQQLDRYAASFVAVRTLALDAFLNRLAKHPILTHSECFRIFLTTPDEELDKVFKAESGALSLWGLSGVWYGGGGEMKTVKTGNGPRVKDPEFTTLVDYLQSLQQKLTALCVLTNKFYKSSAELGTELSSMRRVCDVWSAQERGRVSRSISALGGAALRAGVLRNSGAVPRAHRATLPPLAAYCGAHVEKIRQRDNIHAAYVSGTSSSGEAHNRLEQFSESIRSDLSDWMPKTRMEIKSLLLDMANRQVAIHSQNLMAWEHALKLSSETTNIEDIFKTVSKSAVQNLSPSKSVVLDVTPAETEKDFDDIDEYSNGSDMIVMKNGDISDKCSEDDDDADKSDVHADSRSGPSTSKSESERCHSVIKETCVKGDTKVYTDPLHSFSDVDLDS